MKMSVSADRPILASCGLKNLNYQVDPYIGCEHNCHYCYALDQAETDWTREILMHKDIAGRLGKELEGISPQSIYMGWTTDPYQPCESEYRQTRRVLKLLLDRGFSASILTKSDLIAEDIGILQKMDNASASVSVAFNDDSTRRLFEANAPSTEARIAALGKLRAEGIRTSALLCPVIPHITDALPLVDMLAPITDVIWIYGLSIRDRTGPNWLNVRGILSRHFPDLKERVEETVLSPEHSYWTNLRQELTALRRERQLNLEIHL